MTNRSDVTARVTKAAFEDRRHEQHQHTANRHLRRQPSVQGKVVDPRIATGKQYLFGDSSTRPPRTADAVNSVTREL